MGLDSQIYEGLDASGRRQAWAIGANTTIQEMLTHLDLLGADYRLVGDAVAVYGLSCLDLWYAEIPDFLRLPEEPEGCVGWRYCSKPYEGVLRDTEQLARLLQGIQS